MKNYKLELCNDMCLWDAFVNESPQGSVFNYSKFLSSVNNSNLYYFVKKGEELVSAFSLMLDLNNTPLEPLPFIQYFNNIMFKENSSILSRKKIIEQFKITEFIIDEVVSKYKQFHLINTPEFNDIRPFKWYNYHNKNAGTFKNDILYTATLDFLDKDNDTLLAEMRKNRRREIMKKESFRIIESDDPSILEDLHEKTFKRQGIERSENQIVLLNKITQNSLKNGYGRLTYIYYRNQPVSANLFLFDNSCCYYLFGASHPEYRSNGASTNLMYNNIIYFKNMGFSRIDFVGANSPQRSDYKISFNSKIRSYFSSSIKIKE